MVSDQLAISIQISEGDAASPAILRAVQSLQQMQAAAAPAAQAFQQWQEQATRSAHAVAQVTGTGSREALAAVQQAAREQVRAAADAGQEIRRVTADTARQQVEQARLAVRTAPGPLTRQAAEERLAAARDLARQEQRLAADTATAVSRSAADQARAQVQEARAAAQQPTGLRGTVGSALSGALRGGVSETVGGGLLLASGLGIAAGVAEATRVLVQFGKASFDAFTQFDLAMRQTNAVLGQTGTQAQTTFRQMSRDIEGFSQRMGVDATQSARSLYQVLSAGVRPGADAMLVLTEATKASIGNFVDQRTAVDTLTSVMNAYHLSAQQVPQINDQITKAVQIGRVTWDEYGQGVGRVIALNAQLGLSHAELAGFVANARNQGVSASEVFTDYGAILQAVLRPSDEARRLAHDLRLEFNAQELAAKGLVGFLDEVRTATGGNVDMMARLFGSIEAARGVMVSTGPNAAAMAGSIRQVATAAGTVNQSVAEVNEATKRNLDLATARWDKFSRDVGRDATVTGAGIINMVADTTKALQDFQQRINESALLRILEQMALGRRIPYVLTPPPGPPPQTFSGAVAAVQEQRKGEQTTAAPITPTAGAPEDPEAARRRVEEGVAARHAQEDAARGAQRAAQDAQQAEETAAHNRQRGVEALRLSAEQVQRALQTVQDQLTTNQQQLQRFMEAPVQGFTDLERALGALQARAAGFDVTVAAARVERLQARLEHRAPVLDRAAVREATRQQQLAQAQADLVRAQETQLTTPVDVARRIASLPPELPADVIVGNVGRLAPEVRSEQDRIRAMTVGVQAAQVQAAQAAAAAQAADQTARDHLQAIQAQAAQAQRAQEDYQATLQRAQEVAQEEGRPTDQYTAAQQARLDTLTQQAQQAAAAAQAAQTSYTAWAAQQQQQWARTYGGVVTASGQPASGQGMLLLPSTIGTGPAAWQGQTAAGPNATRGDTFDFSQTFNVPATGAIDLDAFAQQIADAQAKQKAAALQAAADRNAGLRSGATNTKSSMLAGAPR